MLYLIVITEYDDETVQCENDSQREKYILFDTLNGD